MQGFIWTKNLGGGGGGEQGRESWTNGPPWWPEGDVPSPVQSTGS